MSSASRKLYDTLSFRLGREGAEVLSSYIDEKVDTSFNEKINMLPTKEDLKTVFTSFRTEMKVDLTSFKNEIRSTTKADLTSFKSEILGTTEANLISFRSEMKADFAETKSEILKWMFIFWAGQAAIIVGYIAVFIKK